MRTERASTDEEVDEQEETTVETDEQEEEENNKEKDDEGDAKIYSDEENNEDEEHAVQSDKPHAMHGMYPESLNIFSSILYSVLPRTSPEEDPLARQIAQHV